MNLEQLLNCPKHLKITEYQLLLDQKEKLFNKCQKLSSKIQDKEDSLEILKNEIGSERYLKHKNLLIKYISQLNETHKKYEMINDQIKNDFITQK